MSALAKSIRTLKIKFCKTVTTVSCNRIASNVNNGTNWKFSDTCFVENLKSTDFCMPWWLVTGWQASMCLVCRAVPRIFCLWGQTPSAGANFTNLHRDLPYTDRVSSQTRTMLEKKKSFPGGGNCPPTLPPAMYGPILAYIPVTVVMQRLRVVYH